MFIYIYGLDHFSQARRRLDRSNLILLACATRRRSIGRAATECVALQETRNITRARTQIQDFIQEWILYLRGAFHAYTHKHTLANANRHEDATIMHMHVSVEWRILRYCAANVFSNDKKRKRTTDFVNFFELILFNILHPFLISTDWSEQTWNYCNDSATYVVWMRLRMHPCTRVCVFVCTYFMHVWMCHRMTSVWVSMCWIHSWSESTCFSACQTYPLDESEWVRDREREGGRQRERISFLVQQQLEIFNS